VIVWKDPGISRFVGNSDGMLFEISLHPGDVVASITQLSRFPEESEPLIPAWTRFFVEQVEWVAGVQGFHRLNAQFHGPIEQLPFMVHPDGPGCATIPVQTSIRIARHFWSLQTDVRAEHPKR
jgi:hypothetical protein